MTTFVGPATAYLFSFSLGYFFLKRVLSYDEEAHRFIPFLAAGAGAGLSAAILIASLVFFDRLSQLFCLSAHVFALIAIVFAMPKKTLDHERRGSPFIFFVSLCLASTLFFAVLLKSPYGTGLDVWAIWKLKARFIFSGDWSGIFSPVLEYSHTDYPIFYPLMLCWGWMLAGRETLVAGWLFSWIFFLSIVGLVLSVFPPKNMAPIAAVLLLVSTPHFTGMGASQYADTLVAYYGFAACWLLGIAFEKGTGSYFFLSGMFFGMNLLIKNEGRLFLLAGILIWFFAFFTTSIVRRNLAIWFSGVAPFIVQLVWFSTHIQVQNDLMRWENFEYHLKGPLIVQRSIDIVTFFLREVLKENSWVYAWIFASFSACIFFKKMLSVRFIIPLAVFIIVSAGYFCMYLITPLDLQTHLETSFDRLLVHLFPIAIYLSVHACLGESAHAASKTP